MEVVVRWHGGSFRSSVDWSTDRASTTSLARAIAREKREREERTRAAEQKRNSAVVRRIHQHCLRLRRETSPFKPNQLVFRVSRCETYPRRSKPLVTKMTMTIVPEEEHDECDAVLHDGNAPTTAAVLDVTMDIVEDASDAGNLGKNESKKRSLHDMSENESSISSNSNKKTKTCTGLPRRVSTIAGDGSTEATKVTLAASSASTMALPPPPMNNTAAESRRPMIRRVSDYLDDVRRSSLLMVAGQVGEKRNRAGRNGRAGDGTATPGLVTPSSSFLVGSIDPAIVAVQEEEAARVQIEECDDEENEKSLDDELSADTAHAASKALAATDTCTHGSEPTRRNQPQCTWKTILFRRTLPLLVVIEAALLVAERVFDLPFDPTFSLHEAPIHPDSVYVPGAGFSGYWFTLGRLKSIPDPSSKSYYCYSAGCLGVVATLAGKSMHEMSDLAFGVQRRWKEGHLDRYDVVPHFVDGLLFDTAIIEGQERDIMRNATAPVMSDANLLSKLNVITTIKDMVGVRSVIRTPRSIGELREMLIHTTWIPWATGDGLWTKDALTGDHHMDGAFSATTHPRCTHHLGLPFMLDLFLNILNVNLGRDKVEKYWNAGIMLGL